MNRLCPRCEARASLPPDYVREAEVGVAQRTTDGDVRDAEWCAPKRIGLGF